MTTELDKQRQELLMKPLLWPLMLWPSYKRSFDFSGPVKELRSFSRSAEFRLRPGVRLRAMLFMIWN